MNRNIDLTDKGDFSRRQLPKKISLFRFPWQSVLLDTNTILRDIEKDNCERCGTVIRRIPWLLSNTGLCHECSLLFKREKSIWNDIKLQDKTDEVLYQ